MRGRYGAALAASYSITSLRIGELHLLEYEYITRTLLTFPYGIGTRNEMVGGVRKFWR